MRGLKPDDQRQSQGGNMGRDAVMAAIARQSGQAPQSERPKLDSGPMRGLRQVFSGSIFDRRKALEEQERKASSYADGGRVRPRGFVAGPGTGTSDSIKARLSDGEYVLPADTVAAVGVDALDALKDATHTPVAKPDKNRVGEPLFANAGLVGDERKRNSFGDAAAAANDHGVQQVMGQATQMTAAPEVRAAIGKQLDAPARVQAAVSQIPTGISGSRPQASTPVAQTTLPVAAPVADPQVQADRAAIGSAWNSVKGMSENAGRAIADMATLVPRGLVGAYDSAVVRPMRAAGLNAAYLSPALVPDGVDPASMTPFTDQKRMREANTAAAVAPTPTDQRLASGAQQAPGAPAASPINATDRSGDANMPAMDTGARGLALPPGAAPVVNDPSKPQQVMPGIYRQGNSFGDSPEAASWGARGSKNPNANDLAAADALANRSAQEVSAMAARMQKPTAAGFQPMQAPQVEHSGNSWQARNDLRNAEVSASSIMNNGGRWDQSGRGQMSPERAKYLSMLGADMKARGQEGELPGIAMRENAALQREGIREQGLNTRSAADLAARGFDAQARRSLDERRLGLDEKVKGAEVRAAGQQEKLFEQYANAKTDDERARIAKTIRDLSGKTDRAGRWKPVTLQGGTDAMGNRMESILAALNEDTGELRMFDQGVNQGPIRVTSKEQMDKLPRGTPFIGPDGKQYTKN